MAQALAEVEVTVIKRGLSAVLVSDGDIDRWVPHSLIHEDSDITADSPVGTEGSLVLPEWKAAELGLV